MNETDQTPKEWSQHDENVWNAWMHKNAAKDRAQFLKLAKLAGFAAIVGFVLLLFLAWNYRTDQNAGKLSAIGFGFVY